MKKGDWVLCPLTKDDVDNPTIVAKIDSIDSNVINIETVNGIISMPKKYCRVVYVQNYLNVDY